MPIVGFLNCGPTCKANSNARPQTDLRFARILSVWVGQWGRVLAISRMRWSCAERATASRPRTFFFANTYLFSSLIFWYMEIHHQNLTRKARPKKTRTTRIHFRRYPTSITAPVSWISAFLMHSLLICGGSILRASFFFECKEVDVASSHLVSCLASILVGVSTSALVSSLASMLAKSARTSTKLRSINISMYSSSQYQNLHPFYTIKF